MSGWLELVVVAIIVIGLGIAIWKGGGANPESTGKIGRRVVSLEKTVQTKIAEVEKEISSMDERLKQIEQFAPQLTVIRDRQSKMAKEATETATNVDHISKQVDRLYDVIVPKGMGK